MAPIALDTTPAHDVFRVPDSATSAPKRGAARPSYEPTNRKLGDIQIRSNTGPMNPQNLGWLQPVYANTTSLDDMREQFMNQGYLWVKGLVPRSDIINFRQKYFEFMQPTGVLKEDSDPVDGIYCGEDPEMFLPPGNGRSCHGHGAEKAENFIQRSIEAHRTEWLAEVSEHPALVSFVKEFTNWPAAKLLKRQMLRANVPGAETTVGGHLAVHYDHIFLRYGPPTFLTGWLPFGDIPVEGGGLVYLEKSVPLAQSIENAFTKRAEAFTPEERINAFNANMMKGGVLSQDSQEFARAHAGHKWLIADYEAGDVVFHHPYMIHASCVNESPNQTIRLATDLRFVNPEAPYDTRWTNYWYPNDGL